MSNPHDKSTQLPMAVASIGWKLSMVINRPPLPGNAQKGVQAYVMELLNEYVKEEFNNTIQELKGKEGQHLIHGIYERLRQELNNLPSPSEDYSWNFNMDDWARTEQAFAYYPYIDWLFSDDWGNTDALS